MGLFRRAPPTQSNPAPVALPAEVAASTSGSAECEDENLAFKTPCVVAGLSSAAGGASLGFLFGFGELRIAEVESESYDGSNLS